MQHEPKSFSTDAANSGHGGAEQNPTPGRPGPTRRLFLTHINTKMGRSQILGGVVMGIGMGLFEETVYDIRNGHPINDNYANYLAPTNPDIPEIECILLDIPTPSSTITARGIGEIGLTGVTSATYHATYAFANCRSGSKTCYRRR
jgi:Molybdopterin-binding domain of aldehyde dehydrogenase